MTCFELPFFVAFVAVVIAISARVGPRLGLGPWTIAEVVGGALVVLVAVVMVRDWLDPAKRHDARGDRARERGQFARAIDEYTAALAAKPEFPWSVHLSRGIAYFEMGDHDRALADCDQALAINPELLTAYDCRARAYQAKGEYDRALADFAEALRRFPEYDTVYLHRALLHEERGEVREAMADLDQALSRSWGPAAAAYHKARLHERLGEPQEALAAYRRFLKMAAFDDPERKPVRERVRELREG